MTKRSTLFSGEKDQVHLPGAGTLGMALFLVSLGVLFASSVLGFVIIRFVQLRGQPWPPEGFPSLPWTLWISTAVILGCSVAIHLALTAIRGNNPRRAVAMLWTTLGLGVLFLLLQAGNWVEIWLQLTDAQRRLGVMYLGMFYTMTALHGLHVIGGLLPLPFVIRNAARNTYSANYHPGIRYQAMYWHFLDAVWVVLFAVMLIL